MKRLMWSVLLALAFTGMNAVGSGMLIPKDESVPPLAIKHQRVDIDIKDGVATAKIEQVFKNSVNRDIEAVYVFPLPRNASISDFAMYINGKRMSGELVEKGKARKIYEDIVRRMKDPGLLEYLGGDLFKISVYPVPRNGEQRIELEYSQTLAFDAGLYTYVYPLKTGERASKTLEDFTVSVKLRSTVPLKNIYSPSHEVGITRKGEHEATIGFEEEHALLDRDFVFYYGVSKKDFGLNLLTHASKDEDGYFMMMLSPTVEPSEGEVLKKDVTFVFDTSGSMAGRKIIQAREALAYCVKTLNEGDRFNIIRFSTDVEPFAETMIDVNEQNRDKALAFVDKIVARGGTAIDDALAAAAAMDYRDEHPKIVLFLTDGKPTIGESDADTIVKNVDKTNVRGARIFVFGVGDKVNTHLLDKVSGEHGGLSKYVRTDEDIEVTVSSLADKMSHPVLADMSIEVTQLKVFRVHPGKLPDLFSGDQLTVFGRYAGEGDGAILLRGKVGGKEREIVYEGSFPETNADNDFIPRLWATRRVGYLLDEIRLKGEEDELKEEVVRLSKEYGIMTPYTSYLVLEDDKSYTHHGIPRPKAPATMTAARPEPAPEPTANEVFARREAERAEKRGVRGWSGADALPSARIAGGAAGMSRPAAPPRQYMPVFEADAADSLSAEAASAPGDTRYRVLKSEGQGTSGYLKEDSGRRSIELSEAIQSYKTREVARDDVDSVRHVGRKIFYRIGGRWADSAYKDSMDTRTIKFGSEEYFELLREKPELKPFFALGSEVTVVLDDGTAIKVE